MIPTDHSGRALILGGSCALALGLAKTMAGEGMHPVLTYRSEKARTRIQTYLKGVADSYTSLLLDLENRATFSSLDRVLDHGVDYLVDFAHGDLEGLVATADRGVFATYFDSHIANRTEIIQQVTRKMIARRKGRLVYVSSAAAGRPNPGQGFYAAAKQACEALYRNIGIELAGRGVTTVTLRPGYVNAGRGHRYVANNTETILDRVPLGRALETEEVVSALMFLLSDAAMGFNATEITMDGGLTATK